MSDSPLSPIVILPDDAATRDRRCDWGFVPVPFAPQFLGHPFNGRQVWRVDAAIARGIDTADDLDRCYPLSFDFGQGAALAQPPLQLQRLVQSCGCAGLQLKNHAIDNSWLEL